MSCDGGTESSVNAIRSALGFLGERLLADHSLAPLCTYRAGGSAELFVVVDDENELATIAKTISDIPGGSLIEQGLLHTIGKGSNLLVSDRGVKGLVIQLGESFAEITINSESGDRVAVGVGASASLPVVARRTAAMGLTGFEWAVGIPGSVGGAVRMNAGGHGSELREVLTRVHLVDLESGEAMSMVPAQLQLGYRRSSIQAHQIVTAIEIELERGDSAEAERRLSEIVKWRRENQPGGANAGSVFTNPPGDSAGRLIDTAGCKGLRVGTAQISDKHANFIQVDPDGKADDVMELMKEVVQRVKVAHGVTLHAETVLLGFPSEDVAAVKAPLGEVSDD